MSNVKIQGNPAGSGTLTIAAPNTNSDVTLNLPAANGTIMTNSGNEAASFASLSVAGNNISAQNSLGFRNRIINGDMRIAQRGTSFAPAGGYTLDRWTYNAVTTAVATVSQQSDVPNNQFQNSLRFAVTTADTSIAAGDVAMVSQFIEGFNARDLIDTPFTLSFWVRSSKTGVHCVAFVNAGENRSYVAEYSVIAANTWEFKTITVSAGLITSGTWDWTNGVGVGVRFALACGSTFQTTAGAWQTGNFRATANQVNVLDTVGNIFAITGVQLEAGSVATPFERRDYGRELIMCQRYCQVFTAPQHRFFSSTTATAGVTVSNERLSVDMRNAPSVSQVGGATTATLVNVAANTSSTQTAFIDGLSANTWRFYTSGTSTSVVYVVIWSSSSNLIANAEL